METLSIAAFEIDGTENGDGDHWRVELLHRERPDRAELLMLLEPIAARAKMKHLRIDVERVPDADWVQEVQTAMAPRGIGRFWIHGSHVEAKPPEGLVPIELNAGLAFGSGEHGTTEGCLEALDRHARRRRFTKVLDMGCGAGLLAIAAAKCWPAEITAVDNDPVAVEVAAENAVINGVDDRFRAVVSQGYRSPTVRRRGPYDLIMSNILADPLCHMARDLARNLTADGVAILSGLLDRQAANVAYHHMIHGLHRRASISIGPWTTLMMSRKNM
ncbi:MAG: 50S ribosomal protein L11 methyltransferase [Geminicoccaceae bacterium]